MLILINAEYSGPRPTEPPLAPSTLVCCRTEKDVLRDRNDDSIWYLVTSWLARAHSHSISAPNSQCLPELYVAFIQFDACFDLHTFDACIYLHILSVGAVDSFCIYLLNRGCYCTVRRSPCSLWWNKQEKLMLSRFPV